jgi:hypothetical protein
MKIRSPRRHLPKLVILVKPDDAPIWRPDGAIGISSDRGQFVSFGPIAPNDVDISAQSGVNDGFSIGGEGCVAVFTQAAKQTSGDADVP